MAVNEPIPRAHRIMKCSFSRQIYIILYICTFWSEKIEVYTCLIILTLNCNHCVSLLESLYCNYMGIYVATSQNL